MTLTTTTNPSNSLTEDTLGFWRSGKASVASIRPKVSTTKASTTLSTLYEMDQEMKEYLQSIDDYLKENEMSACLYRKEGKTLRLVRKSNLRRDISEYFKSHKDLDGKYTVFNYQINTGKFFKGPMNVICEIFDFKDGKTNYYNSKKASLVFYLLSELEERGFRWEDYKRIFNKLNRGLIP
ncbi:MAG: hypothetical protein EOO43_00625 [Flavobacterium sp.]|nr:MAG: hypothetical protein EOO43_00625 [Flavobacterium sp.]